MCCYIALCRVVSCCDVVRRVVLCGVLDWSGWCIVVLCCELLCCGLLCCVVMCGGVVRCVVLCGVVLNRHVVW